MEINCRGESIGQPLVGCFCSYCYPRLREWYKNKRIADEVPKKYRFKFVKEVIVRNYIIDDNTIENSLLVKWHEINGDYNLDTRNRMKVESLLNRLNRYVKFDARNIKQEVKDYVKKIWNDLNKKEN